jgi:hypothetical protein
MYVNTLVSKEFIHVKFVGCDLKSSHNRRVFNLFKNDMQCIFCRNIYDLCINFSIAGSTVSVVMATKPKAKENFSKATMLLLYI